MRIAWQATSLLHGEPKALQVWCVVRVLDNRAREKDTEDMKELLVSWKCGEELLSEIVAVEDIDMDNRPIKNIKNQHSFPCF